MTRPIQTFSDDYLKQCEKIPHAETIRFLEGFRSLHSERHTMKLISIKIEESLLNTFKFKAKQLGIPYQRLIKQAMRVWLEQN